MNELIQLELKRVNWQEYGTITPENEFHSIWDEDRQTYELINVKELVDTVNRRINEIETQREINRQLQQKRQNEYKQFQRLKQELTLQQKLMNENPLIKVRIRK